MIEERQNNYTVSEGVTLPSKGLIYDKTVNPNVELRGMTGRDELKRSSPSNTPLKTLADIIEGCMIEKPAIHVYDMCLGDYEYLLHRLRVISYGADYKMSVVCPFCGEEVETSANLDTLDVKEFDMSQVEEAQLVTLPKSQKMVKLKIHTPRILDEIELKTKEFKRKYKDAEMDFTDLVTLVTTIDTVDGIKLNSMDLENFILKLPAVDMLKLLRAKDKLNSIIGLDSKMYVTCSSCKEDILTFFRFGAEFFRPTNI